MGVLTVSAPADGTSAGPGTSWHAGEESRRSNALSLSFLQICSALAFCCLLSGTRAGAVVKREGNCFSLFHCLLRLVSREVIVLA